MGCAQLRCRFFRDRAILDVLNEVRLFIQFIHQVDPRLGEEERKMHAAGFAIFADFVENRVVDLDGPGWVFAHGGNVFYGQSRVLPRLSYLLKILAFPRLPSLIGFSPWPVAMSPFLDEWNNIIGPFPLFTVCFQVLPPLWKSFPFLF